jgi:putative transposase
MAAFFVARNSGRAWGGCILRGRKIGEIRYESRIGLAMQGELKYISFNPDIHHRRSLRLRDYDYRGAGAYFVTICSFHRECLFGQVVDGATVLNRFGEIVREHWLNTAALRPYVELDTFVVMPNHFHAILRFSVSNDIGSNVGAKHAIPASRGFTAVAGNEKGNPDKGEAGESFASPLRPQGTQRGSLGAIVQNFKSVSTRKINVLRDNHGCSVWQRDYYDRVIRSEKELANIRQYIADNPQKWEMDENNPNNRNGN